MALNFRVAIKHAWTAPTAAISIGLVTLKIFQHYNQIIFVLVSNKKDGKAKEKDTMAFCLKMG